MFTTTYSRQAVKALRKIPEPHRSRIRTAIDSLPTGNGHVKKLQGEPGYRMRVGHWRIIYDIHHDQLMIEIIKIGPRGKIYQH